MTLIVESLQEVESSLSRIIIDLTTKEKGCECLGRSSTEGCFGGHGCFGMGEKPLDPGVSQGGSSNFHKYQDWTMDTRKSGSPPSYRRRTSSVEISWIENW